MTLTAIALGFMVAGVCVCTVYAVVSFVMLIGVKGRDLALWANYLFAFTFGALVCAYGIKALTQ